MNTAQSPASPALSLPSPRGPFWLAGVVFAADQLSKLALDRMTGLDFHRELIPGFARLVHHRNPGVAFGLLADVDSRWLSTILILIPMAASILFTWLLFTCRLTTARSRFAVGLILGGTVGNLTDRLLHGSVLDFLLLYAGKFQWPAFNVADSAITIGAILFLYDAFFDGRRHAQAR